MNPRRWLLLGLLGSLPSCASTPRGAWTSAYGRLERTPSGMALRTDDSLLSLSGTLPRGLEPGMAVWAEGRAADGGIRIEQILGCPPTPASMPSRGGAAEWSVELHGAGGHLDLQKVERRPLYWVRLEISNLTDAPIEVTLGPLFVSPDEGGLGRAGTGYWFTGEDGFTFLDSRTPLKLAPRERRQVKAQRQATLAAEVREGQALYLTLAVVRGNAPIWLRRRGVMEVSF